MLKRFVNWIDIYLKSAEDRYGLFLTSIGVAISLVIIASIYTTPAFKSMAFGEMYEELSVRPFDFSKDNELQLRILTPLVAHVLFLRGKLYFIFPLIIAISFLAHLYHYFRKSGWPPADAIGVTAALAFSSPLLFLLHYQGYADITSYLLLFWAMILIKRSYIWPVLFALALLNHESNIFAAPWLILLAAGNKFRPKQLLVAIVLSAVACIPMLLFRNYVLHAVPVEYDYGYYLSASRIKGEVLFGGKYFLLGSFMAFKLFWVFPLIGIYSTWKRGAYGESLWFILVILGTFGQLLFAADTYRLVGLAFPAILMGVNETRKQWTNGEFSIWFWRIVLLNFLVPQYCVTLRYVIPMWSLPVTLLMYLFGLDPWGHEMWFT